MIEAHKDSDVPFINVVKDIWIMSVLFSLDEFLDPVDEMVLESSFN